MSYILEAIKRSEQQRVGAGVAGLRTLPVFVDAGKPPPLLLYGAASAALIAAGIGIGWLRPSLPEHTAMVPATASIAPDQGTPSLVMDAGAAHPGHLTLGASDSTRKVEVLHIMRVKPYRAPAHVTAPVATGEQTSHTSTAPAIAPSAPTVAEAPADAAVVLTPGAAPGEKGVLALYELPPKILRAIPPMAISGFTYSDAPNGRMVDINDHLLQEGQYVADGLKLEQITRNGLIFSYGDYRFRKDLR